MDSIKTRIISAQLTKADFLTLATVLHHRGEKGAHWWSRIEPFVVAIVSMAAGYGAAFAAGADVALALAAGVVLATAVTAWAAGRARRQRLKSLLRADGAFLRPFHISADQVGVTMESDVSITRIKWEGIFAIDTTPDLILLFVDKASALAIPKKAFANIAAMNAFADELRFLKRRASEAWAAAKPSREAAA